MCKSVQARILDLEMSEDRAPQIRGVVRAELVADLAIGELSHDQLAEKYERSRFAIDQFSSRNRDEIRLAKQDMSAEDQGLLYAKKQHRLALLEQWLADVEDRLQNADLTEAGRKGYINTGLKLVHSIAEERGELPVRGHFELDLKGNPFASIDAIAIDDDGSLHPVERAV